MPVTWKRKKHDADEDVWTVLDDASSPPCKDGRWPKKRKNFVNISLPMVFSVGPQLLLKCSSPMVWHVPIAHIILAEQLHAGKFHLRIVHVFRRTAGISPFNLFSCVTPQKPHVEDVNSFFLKKNYRIV